MFKAVFFLFLALPFAAQAEAVGFADTQGLLIEYDFRSDGPVRVDSTPLVRVYGDGRLEVAIPWHRSDRGFYVGELSGAELDRLLQLVEESGVPQLNPQDVAESVAQAKAAMDHEVRRSETETTRFAFALAGAKTMRESTWRNIRLEARQLGKSVDEFFRLWQVDRALHELTTHASLKKIAEMPAPREVAR